MTKKLIIPKESFAEMSTASPEYQIRFRLISDDRNRYSAWTPIYSVDPGVTFTATGTTYTALAGVWVNRGYLGDSEAPNTAYCLYQLYQRIS